MERSDGFFHSGKRKLFSMEKPIEMSTFLHRLTKLNRLFVTADYIPNQAFQLGLDEFSNLGRVGMKAEFIDSYQYGILSSKVCQRRDDNFVRYYGPSVCGFCVQLINGNDFRSATGWLTGTCMACWIQQLLSIEFNIVLIIDFFFHWKNYVSNPVC